LELTITAKADAPDKKLGWAPELADFDEVLKDKSAKLLVMLTNIDSTTANLKVVSEPSKAYIKKYKINKDSLKPEQATEIEFELRNDLPLGDFKTALTLESAGNSETRLTIPITGKIVTKITPISERKNETKEKTKPAIRESKPNEDSTKGWSDDSAPFEKSPNK